ncbi:MAG TPA: family 16 glycoside hydrolase, partial [Tepidisphaeraceae bacterium]|nr:family 16 glycoside hydrolase [Tepidisphaeraceae bacterium]
MKAAWLLGAMLTAALVTAVDLHAADEPAGSDSGPPQVPLPPRMTRIFDGKTLDGWIQEPINAITFGSGDITDYKGLAKKLTNKSDPVSAFVADQLDDAAKAALAADPSADSGKALKSALSKNLTRFAAGPSIYDQTRFKGVQLRPETGELLQKRPAEGHELARLNHALLEDAYPSELAPTPAVSWTVKNGALASVGAGRGVIYTAKSFGRYRVVFDIRHVSGNPDHQACVLVFCTAPTLGVKPLDALGGIQFQVPNGGHWDYRPGMNNNGGAEFMSMTKTRFDPHEWCRVEILADAAKGVARMAVAQPPGSKAV